MMTLHMGSGDLPAGSGAAAGAKSSWRRRMKRLVVLAVVVSAAVLPWSAQQTIASSNRSQARAVTPTMLALAKGVFAPAKVIKSIVDPNSNNTNVKVWPRDEHSLSYTSFGRISGYYEDAKWKTGGKSIGFEYDGSIFKTSTGAQAAWHDGSTFDLKFKGTKTFSCPSGLGTHCSRLSALFTNGAREYYDVIQQGSCLSEARVKAAQGPLKSHLKQILTTLANIDHAAFNAMTLSCGS
jgi:hypothetical protein